MTTLVALTAAAEADMAAAAVSYDRQAPGLGNSFIAHVETVLDQLSDYPEMYQVIFRPVRRAVLRRFPFAVIYHLRPASVEVLGVLPCRADPELLLKRAASLPNQ